MYHLLWNLAAVSQLWGPWDAGSPARRDLRRRALAPMAVPHSSGTRNVPEGAALPVKAYLQREEASFKISQMKIAMVHLAFPSPPGSPHTLCREH